MNLPPVSSPIGFPAASVPTSDILRITEPLCAVFRRKLKSVGLKYTPERARILDAVIRWEDQPPAARDGAPASVFHAEQLLASMNDQLPRVSKATLYRTIKLLSEAGIIQQVLLDGETSYYQLAYAQRPSGLLVNVDTGAIQTVDVPELTAIMAKLCAARGLSPGGHRLVIYAQNHPTHPHDTDRSTNAKTKSPA